MERLQDNTPDDIAWIVKGLQKYVQHRDVTPAFLAELDSSSRPNAMIDPDDPVYGDKVLKALRTALSKRIAAREAYVMGLPPAWETVKSKAPDLHKLILGLWDADIDFTITKLIIDGENRL